MKNIKILSAKIRESLTKAGLLLFLAGFIIFMGIISGEIFYTYDFNTRDNYISELCAKRGRTEYSNDSLFLIKQ